MNFFTCEPGYPPPPQKSKQWQVAGNPSSLIDSQATTVPINLKTPVNNTQDPYPSTTGPLGSIMDGESKY